MQSDTVLAFNRELAKKVGVNAALLYQELQRKYFYWESQGKLDDGMFWCDQGTLAEWLLMHPNTIASASAKLEEAGMIERKVSYRPGTTTTTTWWKIVNPGITPIVIPRNHSNCDSYIKTNTIADTDGCAEEAIPQATQDVQVSVYDSDDDGKTITVQHIIPRRDWNKAVVKWRKDEGESVLVTFKDTGATERMTFRRIKKFNVRPKDTPTYKKGSGSVYAKQ